MKARRRRRRNGDKQHERRCRSPHRIFVGLQIERLAVESISLLGKNACSWVCAGEKEASGVSVKHNDAYKPPMKTIGGFNGYQVTSAMQKCIRRGLEEDALFWATELWASCNQTGREYIWHRLRVIASEDVGLADNNACVQVSALYSN